MTAHENIAGNSGRVGLHARTSGSKEEQKLGFKGSGESTKSNKKRKAPVLWTIQCEEVDKNEQEHRGMIRNIKATQRNKWQRKQIRNDEVMTINVNQR